MFSTFYNNSKDRQDPQQEDPGVPMGPNAERIPIRASQIWPEEAVERPYIRRGRPRRPQHSEIGWLRCFAFFALLLIGIGLLLPSWEEGNLTFGFGDHRFTLSLPGASAESERETERESESEKRSDETAERQPESESESESTGETAPPAPSMSDAEALYRYDSAAIPEGMVGILPLDLSQSQKDPSFYYNSSGYEPVLEDLAERELMLPKPTGSAPLVLILHTHASETYIGEDTWVSPDALAARTDATGEGVQEVGKELADLLNRLGIPTLQVTTRHDGESYSGSYERAAATIAAYRATYPSIQYVIDLHRDAVNGSGGELIRPVTWDQTGLGSPEAGAAAQLMFVVGSDWSSDGEFDWGSNLQLALELRASLNEVCPALCRPVYLRGTPYNQQLAPYSILLEVGASGNSTEEALRAVRLFGLALAKRILD